MNEDPIKLANEAARVLAECEDLLEAASESVHEIPARREEALKDIAAAEEEYHRAKEELSRIFDEDLSRWHEEVAEEELNRTSATQVYVSAIETGKQRLGSGS